MTADISKLLQEASEHIDQLAKMANEQNEMIEKMKCCGNCNFYNNSQDEMLCPNLSDFFVSGGDICGSWKLRNVMIGD